MDIQLAVGMSMKSPFSFSMALIIMGEIYFLMLGMLGNILKYFYFSQKTGFHFSCKLFPMETVCMNCQILFCKGGKRRLSIFCLLICLECCKVFNRKMAALCELLK